MSWKCFPPFLMVLWLLNMAHARAQTPGSVDLSFDPGSGVSKSGSARIATFAVQADGKIIIGGDFTTVNGIARGRIARLNPNGSLDTSFDPSPGANNEVLALVLQQDGRVLIAGSFTNLNQVARNRIARLNTDGTLDPNFNPGSGPDFDIVTIALQPDGKVIIGGAFEQVNGTNRNAIARLNSNGALDASFNAKLAAGASVQVIALYGEKLVIGGFLTDPNTNEMKRLNLDGTADASFQTSASTDGEVLSILPQPDGKIVLAGTFGRVQAVSRNRIARLNDNGSLDNTFDPGTGANLDILSAALQPDGRIVIGGNFDQFNGVPKSSVARLNSSGNLDTNFNRGQGIDGSVQSVALQADGKVLVGGFISTVDGVSRNGIARLYGDALPPTIDITHSTTGITVSWGAPFTGFVLESATRLTGADWQPAPEVSTNRNGRWEVSVTIGQQNRYFRLKEL